MKNKPTPVIESKPIKFSGDLKAFEQGQLCYVVARRFEGKGAVKLILHEAKLGNPHPDTPGYNAGYGYGCFRTWVISPGTLTGLSKSHCKAESARINGKLGGRPTNARKAEQKAQSEKIPTP